MVWFWMNASVKWYWWSNDLHLLGVKCYSIWCGFHIHSPAAIAMERKLNLWIETWPSKSPVNSLTFTPSGHKTLDYQHITWKVHSTPHSDRIDIFSVWSQVLWKGWWWLMVKCTIPTKSGQFIVNPYPECRPFWGGFPLLKTINLGWPTLRVVGPYKLPIRQMEREVETTSAENQAKRPTFYGFLNCITSSRQDFETTSSSIVTFTSFWRKKMIQKMQQDEGFG